MPMLSRTGTKPQYLDHLPPPGAPAQVHRAQEGVNPLACLSQCDLEKRHVINAMQGQRRVENALNPTWRFMGAHK